VVDNFPAEQKSREDHKQPLIADLVKQKEADDKGFR
jgi:hypothetical protein